MRYVKSKNSFGNYGHKKLELNVSLMLLLVTYDRLDTSPGRKSFFINCFVH
jgi:hypothetical protein